MPFGTITSTENTFGSVNGAVSCTVQGTLTGSVGVPGEPGAPGVGVPTGGTTGQFLAKTSNADYATGWTTLSLAGYATESWVTSQGYITSAALTPYLTSATAAATYQPLSSMSAYLTKAGNLTGLTDLALARDNLQLGVSNNPVFASVQIPQGGTSVANLGATFLTLNQQGHGQFTIQPSQGIVFPDASIQTTAFPTGSDMPMGGMTGQSLVKVSNSNYDADWATIAGLPASGTVGQVLTKLSGASYDANWATLIPGDRYLTSSTTSLTINNANKTLTIGTGLSYTTQQDIVIAHDASNHMHARVLTYNSGTGVMDVDVLSHTGAGTYAAWTVNVGGTPALTSVVWGDITGTLGDQTDLATALNAKLEITDAASTYAPLASPALTGNPTAPTPSTGDNDTSIATTAFVKGQGYLTSASLTGYAQLSGATFTGKVNFTPVSGVAGLNVGIGGTSAASTTAGDMWIAPSGVNLNFRDGTGAWRVCAVTTSTNSFSSPQVIDTTNNTSAALRVTQKGTANAIEVEDSTTPDSTRFVVDANGKVGIGVAPDATAALKVDTNGIMFGDGTTQTTSATGVGSYSANQAIADLLTSAITSVSGNLGGYNAHFSAPWTQYMAQSVDYYNFTVSGNPLDFHQGYFYWGGGYGYQYLRYNGVQATFPFFYID